jgi:TetR/AcrR family transcriptional repressor of nem operon
MVNTILELADVDDELSRIAGSHLDSIEQLFEDCLREARSSDEAPEQPAPADLARYLMLVNQGLRVASRQGRTRRELAELLNTSMSLLGMPAAA